MIAGRAVFSEIPPKLNVRFGARRMNPIITTQGNNLDNPFAVTIDRFAKTMTKVSKYNANGMIQRNGVEAILFVI